MTAWRSEKIRRPRGVIAPYVVTIEALLRDHEVHICGSWRRGARAIGDLDVLIVTETGELPDDLEQRFPMIDLERGGPALYNGNFALPDGHLHVDFYATTPKQRGAFLWFLTGPMDLNIHMRAIAISQGWMLNQYGLWKSVPWEPKRLEDKSGWVIEPADPKATLTQQEVLTPASFKTRREAQEWIDGSLTPHLGQLQLDDGTESSVALRLGVTSLLDPVERQDWRAPKGPKVSKEDVLSSDGTKTYAVTVVAQGGRASVSCTCPGFKYRRNCRHIAGKGTPSSRPS